MARILVVEDEANIALALEDDLKKEGYDVEIVGDGDRACGRALEAAFDLILLDVMLPHKDGFDESINAIPALCSLLGFAQKCERAWLLFR